MATATAAISTLVITLLPVGEKDRDVSKVRALGLYPESAALSSHPSPESSAGQQRRVTLTRAERLPTVVAVTLRALDRDGRLLFLTRFIRLFAYGSLSVVLVFYLISLGLSESQTGLLLTLTLAGDVVISLYLTTRADRIGRRRMLVVGALLMAAAGVAFAV